MTALAFAPLCLFATHCGGSEGNSEAPTYSLAATRSCLTKRPEHTEQFNNNRDRPFTFVVSSAPEGYPPGEGPPYIKVTFKPRDFDFTKGDGAHVVQYVVIYFARSADEASKILGGASRDTDSVHLRENAFIGGGGTTPAPLLDRYWRIAESCLR